jgi:hypothetical protein
MPLNANGKSDFVKGRGATQGRLSDPIGFPQRNQEFQQKHLSNTRISRNIRAKPHNKSEKSPTIWLGTVMKTSRKFLKALFEPAKKKLRIKKNETPLPNGSAEDDMLNEHGLCRDYDLTEPVTAHTSKRFSSSGRLSAEFMVEEPLADKK